MALKQIFSQTIRATLSFVVPTYNVPFRQVSPKGLGNKEILLDRAKTALLGNLSFFLEPKFRLQLVVLLRGWSDSREAYASVASQISRLIDNRNSLVAALVPNLAMHQVLVSFGFFSIGKQLLGSRGLGRLIDSISGEKAVSLPLESVRIHDPKPETEDIGAVARKDVSLALVAPGAIPQLRNTGEYNFVTFLVTTNTQLASLGSGYKFRSCFFVNEDFVRSLPLLQNRGEWIRALCGQGNVVAENSRCASLLAHLLDREVTVANDALLPNKLRVGVPNLLQRAMAHLIAEHGEGLKLTVFGANLYCGAQSYAAQSLGEVSEPRPDFYVCRSQSVHDPIVNFSLLQEFGRLINPVGDRDFLRVFHLSLDDYLTCLDKCLGESRR